MCVEREGEREGGLPILEQQMVMEYAYEHDDDEETHIFSPPPESRRDTVTQSSLL